VNKSNHGGARPGAGNKKGNCKKVAAGSVREKFGDLMDKCTEEFLHAKDPVVRRRAWEAMLPYNYQRQPQVTEVSGLNKEPIQIEILHIVQDSDQGHAGI
jgi:hypothetical protein